MSLVRYRIWAVIAGVVALASLVSYFRWAARYDGAILIPFLVIGGLALCWWYRQTFKERPTQCLSSATARPLAARSPDEVVLAESRERRQQFSILELMLAVAGAAVLIRLSAALGFFVVPAFGCGLIAWAFAKRAMDQEIGYVMCLGFCVATWVLMLEFEVFD